jgi:hypothetical protein
MKELLPQLSIVPEEYVLIQSWKKTSNYIRYHNWFADTLELDLATADLPQFIARLSNDLRSGNWLSDPLRLVPAPKTQAWKVDSESGRWGPADRSGSVALRPLAHVSLRDQVAATAIMLCLSGRVETLQGDPRLPVSKREARKEVISYGNRLFCDRDATTRNLIHRWGSSKLYRAYFHDYRSFLARPDFVAQQLSDSGKQVVIVQSDLKQFYDRVYLPPSNVYVCQDYERNLLAFKPLDCACQKFAFRIRTDWRTQIDLADG